QLLDGLCDEVAADRGLRGRAGAGLDSCADRLARALKAARGDAGEHLLEHEAAERVAIGEVLIGAERDLGLAVGAAHARALDSHAPPAERHLAVLVAVS